MQGWGGREPDLDGIEPVQHPAVFGDVVFVATKPELGVGQLPVQQIAAVAFVHHDAVVCIHGRRGIVIARGQHALDHALHCGDMHGGVGIGLRHVQLLDAEDVGEGLEVFHARIFEGVGGLLAQGGAVHQEEHAAEALGLQQPVDQGDAGFGLAGAGGHGQ